MTANSFASLALSPEILANLESLEYKHMTSIQEASLPLILKRRDVLAQAKTGSGKTAAFALGILARVRSSDPQAQALVLCPTRELATQVSQEIRRLARFTANSKIVTLSGGVPFRHQLHSLNHGMPIIVGTPGRVLDHLQRKTISLAKLKILVLDEADRMLDMGFAEDLEAIISATPQTRQTLLFSATYSEEVLAISKTMQRDAVEVRVTVEEEAPAIEQLAYSVQSPAQKVQALIALLQQYPSSSTLIFCNTKIQCEDVANALHDAGCSAALIHGDMEQRERNQALTLFANRSRAVLVATDVAARGLDIKGLPLVVNFDLARTPEVHLHRVGRTGRAGAKGLALSLVTEKERGKLTAIEAYQKAPIPRGVLAHKPSIELSLQADMSTLEIAGGRKGKIRKADILGALTGPEVALSKEAIGKIDIFDFHSFVAVLSNQAESAVEKLNRGKIKGRSLKVRLLR